MTTTARARSTILALHAARNRFGREWARRKAEALDACAEIRLTNPRLVRDYHELLLFLAAHPDDADAASRIARELERVGEAATVLAEDDHGAEVLFASGIAGTGVESSFTLDCVDWLVREFGDDVDLAWSDEGSVALDEFLARCVPRIESDGLVASRLLTTDWLALAKGDHRRSDLAWIIAQIRRLRYPPEALDQIFDGLDLKVGLDALPPRASTTFLRFPARAPFFQTRPLKRRFAVRAVVTKRLPAPRKLGAFAVGDLVRTARSSLAIRERETDPVTHANPEEVRLFSLDRGIDIALFGMTPPRRLPVESFFGYLLARNGVPAAYGGGWVFFDRVQIGINVFDAFRGGESAYLFAQIMRTYHQHYGGRRFVVDPFQIGADNDDGLRSGAFWFYYRLGFRPTDLGVRRVARAEWSKIQNDRSYRTPLRILRQLADSELAMHFGGARTKPSPEIAALGLAVTTAIGRRFGGDRGRAERWARARLRDVLGVVPANDWPRDERRAFESLALLMAMIPDLEQWSRGQKERLAALMRAKGGVRERDYVRKMQTHTRLRKALTALAETVETT